MQDIFRYAVYIGRERKKELDTFFIFIKLFNVNSVVKGN